jgi:hypothetical protein
MLLNMTGIHAVIILIGVKKRETENIMTHQPIPSGTLKKLVDIGKKETRVLGSVERWLLAQPRDASRATDVIHPSAMIKSDWCHRAEYFHLQGATPAPPKYRASMKQYLTFDEGHRIHDRWQTWFWNMGHLYGKWSCFDCQHTFYAVSPTECESCNASVKKLKYREVSVYSSQYGMSGHADGWLKGFGNDLLLEIKSVGEGTVAWEDRVMWQEHGENFKSVWKALKSPFHIHLLQAQVYMKLLELMDPNNFPTEAVFIYESKVDQQIKEFVVPKSDFGIAPLFEAAAMIMESIKNQTPPTCNISPSGTCQKCEGF